MQDADCQIPLLELQQTMSIVTDPVLRSGTNGLYSINELFSLYHFQSFFHLSFWAFKNVQLLKRKTDTLSNLVLKILSLLR